MVEGGGSGGSYIGGNWERIKRLKINEDSLTVLIEYREKERSIVQSRKMIGQGC